MGQHLELTRDIARRFHDLYCKRKKRVFREPKALIVKEGARVMSLTDGRAKMSKSAELDNSRINLNDDPATIARKIKKCKSDEFTGLERDAILAEVGDLSWGGFKPRLADAVVAHLEPIQLKYAEVSADKAYLSGVLKSGAERADETATRTLDAAKAAMGFAPRF